MLTRLLHLGDTSATTEAAAAVVPSASWDAQVRKSSRELCADHYYRIKCCARVASGSSLGSRQHPRVGILKTVRIWTMTVGWRLTGRLIADPVAA
jgi:hypothetical protein